MNINQIFRKVLNPLSIMGFILNILQTSVANLLLGYIYMILFSSEINYVRLTIVVLISCVYFWAIIPFAGYNMELTESRHKKALKYNMMNYIVHSKNNIENNIGLLLLQQDTEAISSLYSWPFVILLQAVVSGALSIIILGKYSILMAALLLLSGFLFIVINFYLKKKLKKTANLIREWRGKRNEFIFETTHNIRTIKMYGLGDYVNDKLTGINDQLNYYEKKYSTVEFMAGIIEGILLEGFLSIIIIGYGSYLISIDKIPFNSLLMILQLSTGYTFLFSSVTSLYRGLQGLLLSKEKVSEFIQENPIEDAHVIAEDLERIIFDHCSLGYNDKNIIENFNLSFNFPDNYILSGDNGRGKSTIMKSVIGILPPKKGRVLLNDHDLYKENISFGTRMSYIPQNTYIFNDTLRNNILLGRKMEENELFNILSFVGFDNYLNKIDRNLDYLLDVDSIALSEGEKKRLAVSRALISRPEVLLIDEFDSNLDEKSMLELLNKLTTEYSCIIITHNSSLKDRFKNVDLNDLQC